MATDNSGNSEGTYNSLAFGDGLAISGADNDAYHFAGLDYDFSTASDHAQFRQYNPTSGQWLSPDMFSGSYDFSNPQSLNRYSYVLNNPLSLTDPEGLDFGCGLLCWMPLPPLPPPCCGGGGGGSSPHYIITVVGLRPNASPWDEYHIQYGADIADALGLPDAGCEFGACGAGPSSFGPSSVGVSFSRIKIPPQVAFFFGALAYGASGRQGPLRGPWRYGNFCGQGGKGLPINGVDTACMLHDYCYYQAGATALDNAWGHSAAVQACNQALCNSARSFENQNLPISKEWWAAYQIDNFFTWGSTVGNSCKGFSF